MAQTPEVVELERYGWWKRSLLHSRDDDWMVVVV